MLAHLPYFLASFTWNYGLGMTWLAVPLYGHALGLSGAELGLVFSVPAIAQLVINLVGGAYVDRFGGRLMLHASSLLMAAGAIAMSFAHGFWTLFLAQSVMVLARAIFWPANWSIAADLPGERGVQAGRLNAVTNLGHIAGNGTCGFVLALGGFGATFGVLAGSALLAFVLGLRTPESRRRPTPKQGLFENYFVLLKRPLLFYGMLCAYLSALPFSLSISFYPLLLQFLGFGEEASGVLLALRAVGGIGAGLIVARFVNTGPSNPWPVIGGVLVATGVGLQPLVSHWAAVSLFMLALGVGSSVMTVYFQVMMANAVEPDMRGSALALGGFGWGVSHFTTPLVMGLLTDRYGVTAGFYMLGAVSLVTAGLIAWVRRRPGLLPPPAPAPAPKSA